MDTSCPGSSSRAASRSKAFGVSATGWPSRSRIRSWMSIENGPKRRVVGVANSALRQESVSEGITRRTLAPQALDHPFALDPRDFQWRSKDAATAGALPCRPSRLPRERGAPTRGSENPRRPPMKRVCLFVCVLAAGCSGGGVNTPTSPSSAAPSAAGAPASTALADGQALPLKGSFSIATQASFNCPPTCPPTIMSVTATQEGTATHLGRFTAVQTDRVDLATSTATGTYTFTAADGDQLVATTVSQGEPTSVRECREHQRHRHDFRRDRTLCRRDGFLRLSDHDDHRFCERHIHRIRLVRRQPGLEPVNPRLHTATRTGRRRSVPCGGRPPSLGSAAPRHGILLRLARRAPARRPHRCLSARTIGQRPAPRFPYPPRGRRHSRQNSSSRIASASSASWRAAAWARSTRPKISSCTRTWR